MVGEVQLLGKVALVTGGSRGIGRGIAVALAEAGADVAISYHSNDDDAARVVETIRGLGRQTLSIRANVANPEEARSAVELVAAQLGALHILVNNVSRFLYKEVVETTVEEWREVIESGVGATFYCTKAVIPVMRRQGWGRIINLGAPGAARAAGARHAAASDASKAAVSAFTRALAKEEGKNGITVNVVSPGIVGRFSSTGERLEMPGLPKPESIPVGRYGTPEDIANAVLFLCSERSDHITGSVLEVTGGWGG